MSIIPVEMWADPETGVVVDGDTKIAFMAENGRVLGVTLHNGDKSQMLMCNPPIPFAVGDTVFFDPESREVKVVPAQVENRTALTVGELIAELGKFPQDMLVVQDGSGDELDMRPRVVISPRIGRAWVEAFVENEWRVRDGYYPRNGKVGDESSMGTLTEVVWL